MNTLQHASRQNKPKQIKHIRLHIDMTPMVDAAMLLLTFFMLTAVFNKPQAMELNIPRSKCPVPVSPNKLITFFVDRYSHIFSQNGDCDDILPLPLERLRSELSNIKKSKPDIIVVIKIDRRARYESMIDLLDELNCTSIDRFSIAPLAEKEEQRLQDAAMSNNNSI
jgi:biopolymer transport protein ExbD